MIGRRTVLIGLVLLAGGCQATRHADLPLAPARPAVRPGQRRKVTNLVAERINQDAQDARTRDGRAATLAELKDGRKVAEDRQGYVRALVEDEQVAAIVTQENDDRRIAYQGWAKEHGLALPLVEAIAGDARVTGEWPGRLVIGANGEPVPRQ